MQRLYSSLVAAGMMRDHSWEGTFGSTACPSCDERGYFFFTEESGDFRFGCRQRCDRHEILNLLGLDGYDLLVVTPRFLKRG